MYQEAIAYETLPDGELAAAVMAELKYHYENDEIVKGRYWENGKGCAVGCLLKSPNHMEYEEKFGIPVMLARLEDTIFECLPNELSKKWPQRFMGAALKVGKTRQERLALLKPVGGQLLHWLLTDELPRIVMGKGRAFDDVRAAIAQCALVLEPLTKGQSVDKGAADAARDAAHAACAARAADAAARAAYAARDAALTAYAAARAAAYAARAAAYAADATYAARAAYAAEAAAYAADAAYAAARAADAAADAGAAHERMADKLVELIEMVDKESE